MDVIGPDDHPTAASETSGKLTNGNTTSPENDTASSVTVTVASGTTAGKRKKRKNKAKNSQPELSSSTVGAATATTIDSPPAKDSHGVVDAPIVNNNCSNSNSSHSSSQCNGLPHASQASVEVISKKLEQCVQISGRNGMTNGLPKHAPDAAGSSEEISPVQTTTSSKKNHRSRQTKKTQDDNATHATTCTVVNGKYVEEKQHSCDLPTPKSTAFPDVESDVAKKSISLPPEPSVAHEQAISNASVQPEQHAVTPVEITYQVYESERQMPAIMALIQKDLSEPYSIYTYRYFIHNWPKLCFLALHQDTCVGAIVCKLDIHRQETRRGYIAMLAVDKDYRKLKIGTTLVQKAIQVMLEDNADEVVLETEITNQPALRLYENLGFVRDKRLFHYYLNGVDALRLKLWFR
uniref:N-terminal methionine N(alpha)-acetyltransferase NatC n=1 Tax=Anopheles farauti TaxID=69004 RepID=A0A182QDN3_9DIPT